MDGRLMGVLQEVVPELEGEPGLWCENPTVGRILIVESSEGERRAPRSPWLRSRGIIAGPPAGEKVKVSLTLDRDLVEEIRETFGGQALSTMVNDLLRGAMIQQRVAELADQMIEESGPPTQEDIDQVWTEWLAE